MADLIIKGRPKMAEVAGVTVNGLIKMEQRGLPVRKKGARGGDGHNEYHLPTVFAWLKADQERQLINSVGGESVADLARRRARAEARRAEIEVAQLEKSVISVEVIRKGLEGVVINQRTVMLSLPAIIGREIDEPEVRARITAIVDRRVREALERLARYDPIIDDPGGESDDPDQDESAAHSPTPTPHDQPVGRGKAVSQPRRRRVRPVAERHGAVPP